MKDPIASSALKQTELMKDSTNISTLIDLVSEHIVSSPDRCAASCGGRQISYRELGNQVDCLAAYLLEQNYGSNVLIAVMMERSLDMLVALLGIMKAGHAYLPIDPSFPTERIKYMLEHSQVKTLVGDNPEHHKNAKDYTELLENLEFIDLPGFLEQRSGQEFAVSNQSRESDLAYVIYTSGSTGLPKGVMVPHRAVANLITSMMKRPGFGAADRLAAVTTLSFDISVLELFLPLCAGGSVEIVTKSMASNGEQLSSLLDRESITVMQATPSTWKMLQDAGWQGSKELKVLIGGEAPPVEVIERLVSHCGEVWNMYGPTETTVWSSCSRIESAKNITIGEPIDNTSFHILDQAMQAVPPESEGLLYIGGKGLARGYLFRDDLTDERFVEAKSVPGAKIYNTGDVVFVRADGCIEYRRRADNQIKLRGFRIELGEIESRLNELDGVFQSVVVVRNDKQESELVAYLSQSGETTPSVSDIRAGLSQHLPDYMIPNHFLLVDEMPLTPNGKVDRNNLPPPAECKLISRQDYLPPRNDMEAKIAELWEEILDLEKISVDADFYELGGHSLLITRIWTRLQARFGKRLPLSKLFEMRTIAELAREMQSVSESEDSPKGIPVISRMKAPVMSMQQQRFWYIDQVAAHDSLYNLCSAFTFKGDLSVDLLQECFNRIIQRHEILRTSLDWTGSLPRQIIAREIDFKLPFEDLSELPESERSQVLMQTLNEKVQEKIALDVAPLFKACLLKLDDTRHVLFFMPHHVIWDGWCFDIFLRELKLIYEALSNGSELSLDDLPIQYADYAHWHNRYLDDDVLVPQLQYWRNQLAGELPVLNLPLDHVRPSEFTYNGAAESVEFDLDLVTGINDLARNNGTTVNIVLMAIYIVLLHRYTGQDDIIVGSPIQGRLNIETENMIGLFVNTLPIRIKLESNQRFVELLENVKQVNANAFQNQEVPFERLVEEIVVDRDISRAPIFQTLFTFQEVSNRQYQIGEMDLEQINLYNETCQVDISYWVKSSPESVTGAIEYNPDLFRRDTIQQLKGHLMQLTASIIAEPRQNLHKLDLLTSAEYSRLLKGPKATGKQFTRHESVAQLIDEHAESNHQELAVIYQSTELCYETLVRLSNQLANRLLDEGVEAGQMVAVCIERDIKLAVVLLAIWKCGAAYIPIDPEFPQERIDYILEHSKVSLLVTCGARKGQFETFENTLLIDEIDYSDQPTEVAGIQFDSDTPAYVIYTSGSTGLPKGVVVQHSALLNMLQSMAETPGIRRDDRMIALTTLSFDIHALELWLPLTVGASVVIIDAEKASNGLQIADVLEEMDITIMQATPTSWKMLQACEWAGKTGLKGLIGGEASSPELIQFLLPRLDALWNMYGPTETTVWSTCHKVSKDDKQLYIGNPIANTQVYVLDNARQFVPVGVEGELYIGGAGVSLGYLYDEDKTSAAFVDVDLGDGETRHLYKTSDIVKYHHNGQLQYLRRSDNQVKVRGYRIELGEIEAALSALEQVDDVVVIVREDRPGDKRIVAYYVPVKGVALTITELRGLLRDRLPSYMIPQYLVSLDRLPLTPNGKHDRKAFPVPYELYDDASEEKPKPETETEIKIADMWTSAIGCQCVGRNDNFFDLGGHSLLSMSFINEIRKSTGALLTPRDVVLNDLAQLAVIIDKQRVDGFSNNSEATRKSKKTRLGRMLGRFG